mmetsp:Transcript_72262/g.88647  ORF Transcript_72262/g.88647 Transcript_72262/m.88647 type:complete len:235 (+) Transcript_72262:822-1526(+)
MVGHDIKCFIWRHLWRQHGFLVHMETMLHWGSPNSFTLFLIPAARTPASCTLIKLGVAMAFTDFTGWEPVEVMSINIGSIYEEAPCTSFHLIGADVILGSVHGFVRLSTPVLDLLGNISVPEQLPHPVMDDLIALMRVGQSIIIEALTPEAPEKLGLLKKPMWLANILIGQLPLGVGWNLCHVCIDRKPAISGKPSTIKEDHDLRFPNALRSNLATLLQLALQPFSIFCVHRRH